MSLAFLSAVAIKSTIYLAALFVIAALMSRRPAASRHLLWSVGLIGLMALPFLPAVVPWRIAILPAPSVSSETRGSDVDDTVSEAKPAAELTDDGREAVSGPAPVRAGRSGALVHEARAESDGSAADLWNALTSIERQRAVALIWVFGVLSVLTWVLVGMLAVARVKREATTLSSPSWDRLVKHAFTRMGVASRVRLLMSPRAPVPFGAGIIRPALVFPESAETWSDERRLAVVLHEIAHLRRGDAIPQLMAQLACALFWFHPLAWIAARRLRAESERACDDLVLCSGTRPSQYAGDLIDIVRSSRSSWTLATTQPMARRSEFEGRLLAILEPAVERHGLTPTAAFAVILAVALTAVPLAAMGRASPEPVDEPAVGVQLVAGEDERAASGTQDDNEAHPATDPGAETDARDNAATGAEADAEDVERSDPLNAARQEREDVPSNSEVDAREDRREPLVQDPSPRLSNRSARVAALAAALNDPDSHVRHSVVKALGALQDTTAVRALIAALREDSDPEVRRAAAWALGEIEDARAIPALGEALQGDEIVEVRLAAAHALGEIEDPRGVEPLAAVIDSPNRELRLAVIKALGEIESPAAVEALSRALGSEDAEVRVLAAWALGEIEHSGAVPALSEALRSDTDARVREKAAWALGEIEHPGAVPALSDALNDREPEVRRTAVWALGEIESPSAVEPLTRLLDDPDVEIRRRAAQALGEIESRNAVEPLLAALNDSDPQVRALAADALGEIEDVRAAPALAAALKDPDVSVRHEAADALSELDLTRAPPELIEALQDEDLEVRRHAIDALGNIGDRAAVAGLAEIARTADLETRRAAIKALAEIRDPDAYQVLVEALKDPDPEIRRAAARALGEGNE